MTATTGFQSLGMRHLALWVRDLVRSRDFYQQVLGMKVVWEPDPENLYLTSGADNLALHQIPPERLGEFSGRQGQYLDHFGFIIEDPERVEALFHTMQAIPVEIVKPLRHHRDGSVSFYIADPDGNVIQILYEPHLSEQGTVSSKQ